MYGSDSTGTYETPNFVTPKEGLVDRSSGDLINALNVGAQGGLELYKQYKGTQFEEELKGALADTTTKAYEEIGLPTDKDPAELDLEDFQKTIDRVKQAKRTAGVNLSARLDLQTKSMTNAKIANNPMMAKRYRKIGEQVLNDYASQARLLDIIDEQARRASEKDPLAPLKTMAANLAAQTGTAIPENLYSDTITEKDLTQFINKNLSTIQADKVADAEWQKQSRDMQVASFRMQQAAMERQARMDEATLQLKANEAVDKQSAKTVADSANIDFVDFAIGFAERTKGMSTEQYTQALQEAQLAKTKILQDATRRLVGVQDLTLRAKVIDELTLGMNAIEQSMKSKPEQTAQALKLAKDTGQLNVLFQGGAVANLITLGALPSVLANTSFGMGATYADTAQEDIGRLLQGPNLSQSVNQHDRVLNQGASINSAPPEYRGPIATTAGNYVSQANRSGTQESESADNDPYAWGNAMLAFTESGLDTKKRGVLMENVLPDRFTARFSSLESTFPTKAHHVASILISDGQEMADSVRARERKLAKEGKMGGIAYDTKTRRFVVSPAPLATQEVMSKTLEAVAYRNTHLAALEAMAKYDADFERAKTEYKGITPRDWYAAKMYGVQGILGEYAGE